MLQRRDNVLADVSAAFFQAMEARTGAAEWIEEVYGTGRSSKANEVAITKAALASLGAISEIAKAKDIPGFRYADDLNKAFDSIQEVVNRRPRIDGYIPKDNCFWEAKVSKVDRRRKAGTTALYDIGQWSYDLIKLAKIGRHIPNARIVYSVAIIAKTTVSDLSDRSAWLTMFRNKLKLDLYDDLTREVPELIEGNAQRNLQLRLLIELVGLDERLFHVAPSEKWAIISFDVRPFVHNTGLVDCASSTF